MRTVFWGTPQAAVPFLERLCALEDVVGVVTRPDKPSQRGQQVHASPVKALALQKNFPVLQPVQLKDPAFLSALEALKPEVGIVVAYGRILPKEVIALFPKGLFNIHFSLLPRLRGAAPIQWAIINGESRSGVTSFRIDESLDTGRIAVQKSIGVSEHDNELTLEEKLVSLGILAMEETLSGIRSGTLAETEQAGESTVAPLLRKEDFAIDWSRPAEEIARRVRGLVRPGMHCRLPDGKMLKILRAEPVAGGGDASENGLVRSIERGRGFVVKCGIGQLLVLRVQSEGKKEADAWSFLQGARLKPGDRLV
jgi:methionyl-tRNA formyltransferase